MTAFIAATGAGDVPVGSTAYKTIFAVGLTLFVLTFIALIGLAVFLGSICSQTLHVHQAAFLVDHGVSAMTAAAVISVVGASSILGKTGGGFISVPFMTWCNVRIHNAVATSAALGFPIALAGAIGYVISGLHEARVPPGNIGYINVPSLLCIVATSVLTAPLGAKTAHAMDVKSLKRVFAMLLYSLAAYMAYKAARTV